MGIFFPFLASILLVVVSSSHPCDKLNKDDFVVKCEDTNLQEFPNMKGFQATTYILNGNSFSRLTNTTFPPGLAGEIQILRNDPALEIDPTAFRHLSSSLSVLKLQNVKFEFDGFFEPLVGLEALNSLEIGNTRYSRNLTVPFLNKETLNRLIRLEVVYSGVENVHKEALDSEFKRLRHLGFSHNKLRFIPEGIGHVLKLPERKSLGLDLSYNLLDTLVQEWFPLGCTLTSLNLAYNKIYSVHLHALDNCPLLEKLSLEGNFDLLYISPSVFPSNCHIEPRMEIRVQHTDIRNVEFALRPCVGRVVFSNTSVPCTCRHMSLTKCPAAGELIGECRWSNGQSYLMSDAWQLWTEESCPQVDIHELYSPKPLPDAGDSLASLKDWGDCPIQETPTTLSSDSSTGAPTSPSAPKTMEIETNTISTANTISSSVGAATTTPVTVILSAVSPTETTPTISSFNESHIASPILNNTVSVGPTTTIIPGTIITSSSSDATKEIHTNSHESFDTIQIVTATKAADSTTASYTESSPINSNSGATKVHSEAITRKSLTATPSASVSSTSENLGSGSMMNPGSELNSESDVLEDVGTVMDQLTKFSLEMKDPVINKDNIFEAIASDEGSHQASYVSGTGSQGTKRKIKVGDL
ncbi:hypothetical protein ElyMa_005722500 [Elysia marginata]|uniref:LRRCT domain-containing protein n=1 Tax=Elysia marginata TaxID=1093978 RepID=A0AAV4FJB1_9GAST|nr:hypothetical protein ElyMa_005722500 [Elysia marginata]